jgi:hypothetical protein
MEVAMLSAVLAPLKDAEGPFASVALDVSRVSRATGDDPEQHWEPLARKLRESGAPEEVVAAIGSLATADTGLGGEHTRVVVAGGGQVLLHEVLPGRPAREEVQYGAAPHLMPVARAVAAALPHLLVRLDRTGADIELVGARGAPEGHATVEGDHDVLHKFGGGGWSHRRFQERVEDSIARNTEEVARRLLAILRQEEADLVLVMGEQQAVAELQHQAHEELSSRLVVVESGGRAAGTDEQAEAQAIQKALDEHRAQERARVLDELREQLSRQQRAVDGLAPVVHSLRRGQVERLVLRDDPTSTATLWAGEQPLQLGLTEQEAREAGAQAPQEVRADAAITWALAGSDAELTLVGDDDTELADGIGAVLRWSDEATEHTGVPSMPGHGQDPGTPGTQD